MDFQQLIMLIAWLELHVHHVSQQLVLKADEHALLIVRRGHITVKTEGGRGRLLAGLRVSSSPEHVQHRGAEDERGGVRRRG
ncbi:hypothetical protein [Bacillus sp. FJAT-26390]|uniref:hypothetical protein n=1 Tax=Bacillus sp. FJAT-26390 TaxID=1743142 RepID=UPI000807E9EA|nr:hypothetical protein [Bacillus sp. FJAT-26390]OBZ11307.1 hypothetical protein A7975_20400 [Bacillus sp. FJAT-26390]